MAQDQPETEIVGWERFCEEIASLIHTSELRIGHSDRAFGIFITERLQLALVNVSGLWRLMSAAQRLSGLCDRLHCLLEALRQLITSWEMFLDRLDVQRGTLAYQAIVIHTRRRGRPKFHISKDQLTLLRNLSFSWTRIAGMLGVSRMTIYRRRRVYNLLVEGDAVPDDVELDAILRRIRLTTPDIGQTLLQGHLRSMGYRVTRERLRTMVRAQDPLNNALRMPGGVTSRTKYSVAGPNSLWHIGVCASEIVYFLL